MENRVERRHFWLAITDAFLENDSLGFAAQGTKERKKKKAESMRIRYSTDPSMDVDFEYPGASVA